MWKNGSQLSCAVTRSYICICTHLQNSVNNFTYSPRGNASKIIHHFHAHTTFSPLIYKRHNTSVASTRRASYSQCTLLRVADTSQPSSSFICHTHKCSPVSITSRLPTCFILTLYYYALHQPSALNPNVNIESLFMHTTAFDGVFSLQRQRLNAHPVIICHFVELCSFLFYEL